MGEIFSRTTYRPASMGCMMEVGDLGEWDSIDLAVRSLARLLSYEPVREITVSSECIEIDTSTLELGHRIHEFRGSVEDMTQLRRILLMWAAGEAVRMIPQQRLIWASRRSA